MALSQIQCLDDNHVNPRRHESKPEFLYCEDQRLALETFLRDGREAFVKYLEARELRGFLSDPELETLAEAVKPYDPGTDLFPENAEDDEPPLSLHYWPDLSDTSIPQMDLGWPDSVSYRGVTRTTVYAQPPLEGQAHIKEVVRKMIAQAQKVIAVVMDVFTDVDIFRDLLDAGVKRKVSVYILLARTTLPHFLSMCQRANMHPGHLKNLRVRCTDGAEFYTRSCTKVTGRMGHRFMFIDGDKAVSGSYSFTWTSSRLDTSLITVVTGQAVEAFDRLFRILYSTSSLADLRKVATEPEPELEALPPPVAVAPLSADIARKLNSPKYALVTLGKPSPTPSVGPEESQNPKNSKNPETKNGWRSRANKEAIQETPSIHPGLSNLEKACLMSYLPTWPEPDPPSDVIGFINIRDASKPNQVHLQRSEMFETSQAVRFSSPFSMPKEILPEVAKPRQFTAKYEEMNKLQLAQDKTKAEESLVGIAQPTQVNAGPGDLNGKAEAPAQKSPASGPKCESDKDTTKTLNIESKRHSNTPTNQDTSHNTALPLSANTPRQSSSKASTPTVGRPSHTTQTVTTLPGSNTKKEAESDLNTQQHDIVNKSHVRESSSTHAPQLCPADSNTESQTQTKTVLPHTESHTQPQNVSDMTPNVQTPTVNSHMSSSSASATRSPSVSSTSLSENNYVSITTSTTPGTCSSLSSISSSSSIPPLTSALTPLNPPPPSSSPSPCLNSTPPIPKPRTLQLVIKGGVMCNGQKLPELSVVRRPEASIGPLAVHDEPDVATVAQTSPEKVPETTNNSGSETRAQKAAENTERAPRQKQSGTSQATKKEVVGRHDDIARMQFVAGNNPEEQSHVFIADAPKAESLNSQEIIPKDVEPKTLTSIDCKLTPQIDCEATLQTEIKAPERALTGCEFSKGQSEKSESVTEGKTYLARAHAPQRISYSELMPQDIDTLETVDSIKAPTHTPVSSTHLSKDSAGDSTHTSVADTQGNPGFTPAQHTDNTTDNMPAAKHNTQGSFQEQSPKARSGTHTPEGPLRLRLPEKLTPDLRSMTPEREPRSLTALIRTPTPDGYLPLTPSTPDSRTHTPDPRSYTPDFRTPTPDEYFSPRADSALSTTSEDSFYECNDSPFHEAVLERAASSNHGRTEDRVCVTHTNTPNDTTTTSSPARANSNTRAATLGTTDRNTSSSETQSLSRPAGVSSSSSLLEKEVKMVEEKESTNEEEGGREEDEKGRKLSAAERRTEGDNQGTETRGSEEAKRTADRFKQGKDLTEAVEKNEEAQYQAPKREMALNHSPAGRAVDGGVTPGELTNERTELKQLPTGDLQPKKASSEEKRADKEKAVDKAPSGPSSVERRDRPHSATETDGQKSLLFSSFCTLLPKPLEDSSKTVEGPPLPDHPDPLDPSQPPSLVPGEAVS
ncbi:flocculation protein FLO11-like isoform X2 [Perca fluviatilis]|uniref:flocculation protein FLO11-like isoform X2 n=1 Tax=Perca fluviatilis TaxID=8168 RepID=UPI0019661407|nr:flocculation protein FLO11-like isoform X2 [Perca fluviatilis]